MHDSSDTDFHDSHQNSCPQKFLPVSKQHVAKIYLLPRGVKIDVFQDWYRSPPPKQSPTNFWLSQFSVISSQMNKITLNRQKTPILNNFRIRNC